MEQICRLLKARRGNLLAILTDQVDADVPSSHGETLYLGRIIAVHTLEVSSCVAHMTEFPGYNSHDVLLGDELDGSLDLEGRAG